MRTQRAWRQAEILKLLDEETSLRLSELHKRFGVSLVTLRADLAELEAAGQLIRTHGGAVKVPQSELPYAHRAVVNAAEKAAIGRLAANFAKPGELILLDTGSTTLEVARQLATRPEITLITNDLPIGLELCARHHPQSHLLGGTLSTPHRCVIGPETERLLDSLTVDKLFLAADAITEQGLMERSSLTVPVKQAMLRAASEVILVVDSSKFGERGLAQVCELARLDHLVTDEKLPREWRERLQEVTDLVLAPL